MTNSVERRDMQPGGDKTGKAPVGNSRPTLQWQRFGFYLLALGAKGSRFLFALKSCVFLAGIALGGLVAPPQSKAQDSTLTKVSVSDLVAFRRIEPNFSISPDRRFVAYVVREANLVADRNDYLIYVQALPTDRKSVTPSLALNGRSILRTQGFRSRRGQVEQILVRWAEESRSLYVLHHPAGDASPGISRIFLSGKVERVRTDDEVELDTFTLDWSHHRLLYGGIRRSTLAEEATKLASQVITPDSNLIRAQHSATMDARPVFRVVRALDLAIGKDTIAALDTDLPDASERRFSATSGPATVFVRQSPSMPPDLFLRFENDANPIRLTEANPQLTTQSLGRVELLEWTSHTGNHWGHIVYPPGYKAGERYPCAILAKSWTKDGFIYESQYTYPYGNFPAQALANNGIVVLMLSNSGIPHGDLASLDGEEIIEAYYSARRQLSDRGIIDSSRCGLMGFSHTGWLVDFVISHPRKDEPPWAAAVSLDHYVRDFSWVPLTARERSPMFRIGKLTQEQIESIHTVDDARELFLNRSAAWNASRIRTPVLQEVRWSVESQAEMYSALWVRGKPIEVVWMPGVEHTPIAPSRGAESMQRTIDWFGFWLQGKEPEGPVYDPDRFARWQELRRLHLQNENWISQGKDPNAEWLKQVGLGQVIRTEF